MTAKPFATRRTATSGTDGSYRLTGLVAATFNLGIEARGYTFRTAAGAEWSASPGDVRDWIASPVMAVEVIATLPPRNGLATRRLLAVNAVLAGCPEGLLPVLVTAVRALGRGELNLRGVNATTHPVAPLAIVHGDAVDALDFNAGLGTFGPGHRANATLGIVSEKSRMKFPVQFRLNWS